MIASDREPADEGGEAIEWISSRVETTGHVEITFQPRNIEPKDIKTTWLTVDAELVCDPERWR